MTRKLPIRLAAAIKEIAVSEKENEPFVTKQKLIRLEPLEKRRI